MRKVLGRVALLLGVIVVGAAGWWGAVTLFDEDRDEGADDRPTISGCEASTPRQARAAERQFSKDYPLKQSKRWLTGYGVSDTRALELMADQGIGGIVPSVGGDGAILLVMSLPDADVPELPECLLDVPLVVVTGGPFHFD